MNHNDSELLKYIIRNNLLDVDATREQMEREKVQCYVEHYHQHAIFQLKDGRWKTYVPDKTKAENRIQIVKKSKDNLYVALYDYYNNIKSNRKDTIKSLYPKWLEYKSHYTRSTATLKRIDDAWNKFYKNSDIVKTKLVKLDQFTCDLWCHQMVEQYRMTKKQYYNFSIIIRQVCDYAVSTMLIGRSPMEGVIINSKLFKYDEKPRDHTQVFLMDEEKQIEEVAYSDYKETKSIGALAILFTFQTGLRLGEILGLKYGDIKDNYVQVRRMETKSFRMEDGNKLMDGYYEVVDRTKTRASIRNVYLTSAAREILSLVEIESEKNGWRDDDYIFVNEYGKLHRTALDYRIRKYCRRLGIEEKSMHKIRKTYISTLIDSGLNINTVRIMAGHEDTQTTYNNYCFNRLGDKETEEKIENVFLR